MKKPGEADLSRERHRLNEILKKKLQQDTIQGILVTDPSVITIIFEGGDRVEVEACYSHQAELPYLSIGIYQITVENFEV